MNRFQSQAQLLKLIAHPARLRLLMALSEGEECVCHLTALVQERQAYVSQQLMFLRRAGLLKDRKEGARVYYRINNRQLFDILAALALNSSHRQSFKHQRIAACPCPRCTENKQSGEGSKQTAPNKATQ